MCLCKGDIRVDFNDGDDVDDEDDGDSGHDDDDGKLSTANNRWVEWGSVCKAEVSAIWSRDYLEILSTDY